MHHIHTYYTYWRLEQKQARVVAEVVHDTMYCVNLSLLLLRSKCEEGRMRYAMVKNPLQFHHLLAPGSVHLKVRSVKLAAIGH